MLDQHHLQLRETRLDGVPLREWTLAFDHHLIRARDLIRRQVLEEVENHNQQLQGRIQGLLMGKRSGPIDAEKQVAAALAAFEANGFFILVDDRQIESLDELIAIDATTQVSFIKLVPLVGG